MLEIDNPNFSTQNTENDRFAPQKALKPLIWDQKPDFLSISGHSPPLLLIICSSS
jgi:hypothetical protein